MGNKSVMHELACEAKRIDPDACVFSYLDDGYFWIQPDKVQHILDFADARFARFGLTLQRQKLKAWTPNGAEVPGEWGGEQVRDLIAWGHTSESLAIMRNRQFVLMIRRTHSAFPFRDSPSFLWALLTLSTSDCHGK